jgi:hypothetical protein
MATDKKLQELENERIGIEDRILNRKQEIAREQGRLVSKVNELTCSNHPKASFRVSDKIPESFFWASQVLKKDALELYVCTGCESDKNARRVTNAYDCPQCGIVYGAPEERKHDSMGVSPLAGAKGEEYHCTICDVTLGHYFWAFS